MAFGFQGNVLMHCKFSGTHMVTEALSFILATDKHKVTVN